MLSAPRPPLALLPATDPNKLRPSRCPAVLGASRTSVLGDEERGGDTNTPKQQVLSTPISQPPLQHLQNHLHPCAAPHRAGCLVPHAEAPPARGEATRGGRAPHPTPRPAGPDRSVPESALPGEAPAAPARPRPGAAGPGTCSAPAPRSAPTRRHGPGPTQPRLCASFCHPGHPFL